MSTNNNVIEPRLQYNYAKIRIDSGLCVGCMTASYVINNDAYILVPDARDEYVGKYYNRADGLWYYDSDFTQIFDINSVI